MLFVVVLSLAALAAAEPEIQQKVQQVQPNMQEHQQQPIVQEHQQQPLQNQQQLQMAKEVNTVPFYKQIPIASPLSIYGGNMNPRYFPYIGQMMENFPFLPYNYKNLMSYPYRSNYFLRELNKPETKVDYGYDDMYHVRAINHHHLVNNVHDVKQKHILRQVDTEIETPYSPMSYKYTNNYQSKGKSLDQEYIQPYNYYKWGYPLVNQYYGKSLEQDYIQPYNLNNRGYPYVNKFYGKSLNREYIQPYNNYNRYWDMDYIRNYYGRNLDTEFTTPYPWSLEYTRNYQNVKNMNSLINPRSFFSQLDTPVPSRKWNFDNVRSVQPGPVTDSAPVLDFFTPRLSRNVDMNLSFEEEPLDYEYYSPENVNSENQPDYVSRNNPETFNPFSYNNWNPEDVQGRFKRSEPVKMINLQEQGGQLNNPEPSVDNVQQHGAGVPIGQLKHKLNSNSYKKGTNSKA